ncbi:MAG TPA: cob(I)yrinic acid a,c-diamide adenosyltransferase [Dehalococcoidia bacterium]|jgi:cob(I)alamin adenosyltransferase|nr:cob(I)yrinic acid a,c-diamide adenosyltransferase [Dehalococcoidia bacterium]
MPDQTPPKSQIYTRTGDAGTTALFGGGRVPKDHPRVAAFGAVDELNSAIGVAIAFLAHPGLVSELTAIQNELFNIGAELASEGGAEKAADFARLFTEADRKIGGLENVMDELDAALPPLKTFVLPSGSQGGALLHLCRTICRRAERAVVTLSRGEAVNPDLGRYLNRLGDLLFVMARYVNQADGHPETEWRKE